MLWLEGLGAEGLGFRRPRLTVCGGVADVGFRGLGVFWGQQVATVASGFLQLAAHFKLLDHNPKP